MVQGMIKELSYIYLLYSVKELLIWQKYSVWFLNLIVKQSCPTFKVFVAFFILFAQVGSLYLQFYALMELKLVNQLASFISRRAQTLR